MTFFRKSLLISFYSGAIIFTFFLVSLTQGLVVDFIFSLFVCEGDCLLVDKVDLILPPLFTIFCYIVLYIKLKKGPEAYEREFEKIFKERKSIDTAKKFLRYSFLTVFIGSTLYHLFQLI